jgi:hypothetical protein
LRKAGPISISSLWPPIFNIRIFVPETRFEVARDWFDHASASRDFGGSGPSVASHDIITFMNGASTDPTDYSFA